MANLESICEHIHLPVQSGDNEVLRRMWRGYTVERYLSIIEKLVKGVVRKGRCQQ